MFAFLLTWVTNYCPIFQSVNKNGETFCAFDGSLTENFLHN